MTIISPTTIAIDPRILNTPRSERSNVSGSTAVWVRAGMSFVSDWAKRCDGGKPGGVGIAVRDRTFDCAVSNGTMISHRHVGQVVFCPPQSLSQARCCPHESHENLMSLMSLFTSDSRERFNLFEARRNLNLSPTSQAWRVIQCQSRGRVLRSSFFRGGCTSNPSSQQAAVRTFDPLNGINRWRAGVARTTALRHRKRNPVKS